TWASVQPPPTPGKRRSSELLYAATARPCRPFRRFPIQAAALSPRPSLVAGPRGAAFPGQRLAKPLDNHTAGPPPLGSLGSEQSNPPAQAGVCGRRWPQAADGLFFFLLLLLLSHTPGKLLPPFCASPPSPRFSFGVGGLGKARPVAGGSLCWPPRQGFAEVETLKKRFGKGVQEELGGYRRPEGGLWGSDVGAGGKLEGVSGRRDWRR
ncbi:hypothetical protein E2320_010564, partial [Naja naja]